MDAHDWVTIKPLPLHFENISPNHLVENISTGNFVESVSTDNFVENISTDIFVESVSTDNFVGSVSTDNFVENVSTGNFVPLRTWHIAQDATGLSARSPTRRTPPASSSWQFSTRFSWPAGGRQGR